MPAVVSHLGGNSAKLGSRHGKAATGGKRRQWLKAAPLFVAEPLEARQLLSGTANMPIAFPVVDVPVGGQPTSSVNPISSASTESYPGTTSPTGVISPNQMRGAYGLGSYTSGNLSNGISVSGIQGDGRGQTIAIVDAYDDPTAATDLNAFSSYYGLPTFGGTGHPTFQKLNQTGNTSPLPGTDPYGPYYTTDYSDWEWEETMDIEWAHVIAPMASIDLFEATNDSTITNLLAAVQAAANTPGVVAVSMSWGWNEFSGENSDNSYFVTPPGHIGGSATIGGTGLTGNITFAASSGDSGAYLEDEQTIGLIYPTTAPNVVSVGGTYLTTSGTNPNYAWSSETSWGNGTSSWNEAGGYGGSGGGLSAYESQPGYQNNVVNKYSTGNRTCPDISLDSSPYTGVPIYDAWDFGNSTPWCSYYMGGTSLSSPMFAAMVAVADEGRAIAGYGSLDGRNQVLPALYNLANSPTTYAADFHDITSGSTGSSPTYVAGTGYDLVTGIGSPKGNLLIPALASIGPTATTLAVTSSNGSSTYGQSVAFTATVTPSSGSGETGNVTFQIDGGNVATVALSGNTATDTLSALSAGNHSIVAIYSGDGNFATSTSSTFTQTVAKAADITVLTTGNSAVNYGQSVTFTATITPASGSGETGNVTFQIDGGNVGTMTLSGNTATYATSALSIGNHTIVAVYSGDGNFITSTSAGFIETVAPAWLNAGGAATWNAGNQTLTVTGNATIAADPATSGNAPIINAGNGSRLTLATAVAHIGGLALQSGATLDIANDTLFINYGNGSSPLAAVQAGVQYGAGISGATAANGAIISSTAKVGNAGQYAVGFADNTEMSIVPSGNVELMYTLTGDSRLTGSVNFLDYSIMQNNYNQTGRDWAQGDWDDNGTVNFLDYSLMQNNYNQSVAGVVTGAAVVNAAAAGAAISRQSDAATPVLPVWSSDGNEPDVLAGAGRSGDGIVGYLL